MVHWKKTNTNLSHTSRHSPSPTWQQHSEMHAHKAQNSVLPSLGLYVFVLEALQPRDVCVHRQAPANGIIHIRGADRPKNGDDDGGGREGRLTDAERIADCYGDMSQT
jgi:hypothetical protein